MKTRLQSIANFIQSVPRTSVKELEKEMPANGYTNSKHTYIYSLNFTDDQVLLAQDHDDMEYMARKLKEEYEKMGLTINLEKTKYICMGERK
jgi:hypothetical protein